MIGKNILHYKILEKLGEGGMGIVYLAEDTKLERKVAIKFLPRHIAGNSEERKRFEIEAKAAAALNHPNIATIYAIEETDDDRGGKELFIVMEYIDGQELKEKLKSGAFDPETAKNIAIQIAGGLQAAHEKHIIHRDIKSTNIMITQKGDVKIMDFGLAKFRGAAQLTQLGTTIGTAAYMSPEQAQGQEIDQRTDIWSFGVVLYEMLSGELLFKGDYEQAVIFSILNDDVDLTELKNSNVPQNFIEVITKCLNRSIDKRYSAMQDIIDILTDQKPQPVEVKSKQPYMIYGILGVVIIALLLWNQFGTIQEEVEVKETKFTKITFDNGLEDEPSWSPDGKFLAYTTNDKGNFDIIVKPLDGGNPIRIVDHPADDAQASWSPDGNRIAFVSSREHGNHLSIIIDQAPLTQYIYAKNGDIFVMPALGGQQIKVVENGYYPQWSPDSKMLTYQSNTTGHWDIWITPVSGGSPLQLTDDPVFDYHPTFSADGKWILYASRINQFSDFSLNIIPVMGGTPIQLLYTEELILNPRFSKENDYIIFSSTRNGAFNIIKMPIDLNDVKPNLQQSSITLSESEDVNLSIDLSAQRIAYSSVTNNPDIYELDLQSEISTAIVSDNAFNDLPQLSPDGKKLLYQSNRGGVFSGWLKNLETNEVFSLNTESGFNRWTADGSGILFGSKAGLVYKKPGDANEKVIVPPEIENQYNLNFAMSSLDSRYIACGSDSGIVVFDKNGDNLRLLTRISQDNHPTWSPDNRLIVFQRGRGTGRDLYIIDLEGNERQLTSGTSEDSHPFWSPANQDQILFLRDHKNLFLISVSSGQLKQVTNYNKANITLDYPSFSFDGKKVYYSLFNKIGDIFILENF